MSTGSLRDLRIEITLRPRSAAPDTSKKAMPRQYKHKIFFANLTWKVGNIDLVDHAAELAIPTLQSNNKCKGRNSEVYGIENLQFFHIQTADEIEPCLFFEFVVEKTLHAEQQRKEGRLVPTNIKVPSAPSAKCVLALSTHRLMMFRTMRDGPSLKNLETFLKRSSMKYWDEWIDGKVSIPKGGRGRPAMISELKKRYPNYISIINFTDKEQVEKKFLRMTLIRSMLFTYTPKNGTIDTSSDVDAMLKEIEDLHAKNKTERFNAAPGGMNAAKAAEIFEARTSTGNVEGRVTGAQRSEDGAETETKFSNTNVSAYQNLPQAPPEDPRSLAVLAFEKLSHAVDNKLIPKEGPSRDVFNKYRKIGELLFDVRGPENDGNSSLGVSRGHPHGSGK